MRMKEEALNEFVDNIIQERMQSAFSQMKAGKEPDDEDDVERKYEEAVALLPEDKQQAVRAYCDAIFDSGADAEQFFYRLGLKDDYRLEKLRVQTRLQSPQENLARQNQIPLLICESILPLSLCPRYFYLCFGLRTRI